MPVSSGTGNTAPGLTTTTALFLIWAVLSFVVRVWTKVRKGDGWGAEDTTLALAGLALIANAICVCYAVHYGYGAFWHTLSPPDAQHIRRAIYASQIFYPLALGLTKASASFFIARFLSRGHKTAALCNTVVALCGAWTVASTLAIAIRSPLQAPWQTMDGSRALFDRWLPIEVTGFAIDLLTVMLPVYLISTLQMRPKRKVALSSIFALRLAVAPIVALRLYHLSPSQYHDDKPSTSAEVFTQIVVFAAFLLASITCLKPFLQPFYPHAQSSGGSSHAYTVYERKIKGSRREEYYELGVPVPASSSKPKHSVVSSRKTDIRPDQVAYQVSAQAQPSASSNTNKDKSIFKTQAWSVAYD